MMRDETTGKEKNLFFYCAQPIRKILLTTLDLKSSLITATLLSSIMQARTHTMGFPKLYKATKELFKKKFSAKRLFTLAMDKSSFFQSKKPKDLIFEKSQQANKSMEYLAYNKGISLEEDELEFFFHNCLGSVEIQNELRKPANINWNTITQIIQNDHSHDPNTKKNRI